jgi:hypothetical protein
MTPRASVALALFVLGGTTPRSPQQTAFTTKVESVRVDVLVIEQDTLRVRRRMCACGTATVRSRARARPNDALIARDRRQIVIEVRGELFARPRTASA